MMSTSNIMDDKKRPEYRNIRVSPETYKKLQDAQRPRESYGDVTDRAATALLREMGLLKKGDTGVKK